MRRAFRMLYKAFICLLATIPLVTYSKPAYGPSAAYDEEGWRCLISAVYHEARGESPKGKRAVLEVVLHRAAKSGESYCEVVAKKRQFPWFAKKGLVQINADTLKHYNDALQHEPVLKNEKYIYFNGYKPFGVGCKRIGKHTFCKEK